ncbi:hypothetical protein E8E12_002453 [Didymella heteroderae]|uniref:Uncharacterized protein n=1 Tax=Didymella heteroderae TaxID=1769908 RepID=A0A9P4WGM1_9PLEO|nr:hypothetical protein E8E12_002453 [Didymella heteroderae]
MVESYEDRLAVLQKELDDGLVMDLNLEHTTTLSMGHGPNAEILSNPGPNIDVSVGF